MTTRGIGGEKFSGFLTGVPVPDAIVVLGTAALTVFAASLRIDASKSFNKSINILNDLRGWNSFIT